MSSEDFSGLKAMSEANREFKRRFGVNCAKCIELTPKRTPSKLLPGQRCRMDGYVDPRPRITQSQRDEIYQSFGLYRG